MNADEVVKALRDWNEQYLSVMCASDCAPQCYEYCDGVDCIAVRAADCIESLQAQLAASQRRERAAVEMLIKFIKQSGDTCDYCKNHIECAGEQCEEFENGVGGTGKDGTEFPDWHWQCTIFDYGTCAMLANTPCNGCFDNHYSGFEWRGPQAGEGGR